MRNLKILLIITLVFSCTPSKKNEYKNRRYSIIISNTVNGNEISGFSIEDNNDTLRLLLPVRAPRKLHIIIIDDETKTKIRDAIRYHFDIENFRADKDNKAGSVTFEVSNSKDKYRPHYSIITAVRQNIYSSKDVSEEYSELIVYLKKKYPEFKSWPDRLAQH